ncbi:MAG: AAA family ATPase [Micromonosporaceae bacterium]|nr:AAA family ATPase [Micromonosporaceae bacterium]
MFVEHGADRYTSQARLDAEARLVKAARTPVTTCLPEALVAKLINRFETTTGTRLDAGQRAMVIAFVTDPHLITVGLGPAGACKTTTMRAYQHVLAQDLGVPAENVHKFVHEHRTAARRVLPAGVHRLADRHARRSPQPDGRLHQCRGNRPHRAGAGQPGRRRSRRSRRRQPARREPRRTRRLDRYPRQPPHHDLQPGPRLGPQRRRLDNHPPSRRRVAQDPAPRARRGHPPNPAR